MSNRIELKARAKINLSLDVTGKRPDGYHDLRMLMQTVELHDLVRVEASNGGIEVTCDSSWVPSGPENIAYKAAALIIEKYGLDCGVRIGITKRIPVAAGLAGGSSDCAAVIKAMNSLFSLKLNAAEMMALGKNIGADVPYCINGGTMLAEGIGDILTRLEPLEGVDLVLVKPRIGVATSWVYNNLRLEKIVRRPDTELLLTALKEKRIDLLARNMVNVLETVTQEKYSVIRDIKEKLVELGALGSMMSGSGPTVFGIFEDQASAKKALSVLKNSPWECIQTKTICEER
ncbi:MAG: 4-(cytidine 5'-diphospho)-2-C-methyl-D-erythritol kinase [Clostridia bacterium]|nr:4-(cytidine 5'-diphospho)-2-C-methyl-D-erythritol kinase [Clostridia bacterium]